MIRNRKLSATNDWSTETFSSHGVNNLFLVDSPESVQQHLYTLLNLTQGEWFLDTTAGTPWKSVLGNPAGAYILIKSTIESSPYVNSLTNFNVSWEPKTRTISLTGLVNTIYGSFPL